MAAAVDAASARVSPSTDAMKDGDLCSGEDDDVIFVAVTHNRARKRTRTRPPPPPSDVIVIEDDPTPCPSHSEMNKRPVLLEGSGYSPTKRPKLSAGSAETTSRSSCLHNDYAASLSPKLKTPPSFSSAPSHPLATPMRQRIHSTPTAVSPRTSPLRFGSCSQQDVRENNTPCSSRSASRLSRKPLKLRHASDSPTYSQNSPTYLPTQRILFSKESASNSSPGTLPRTDALQPSSPSSPPPRLSTDHRTPSTEAPRPLASPCTTSRQRHLEEGTTSLCIKQENASSEDGSNYSKPIPLVQLAPSFCALPSCPCPTLQQYGRTGEAYLGNYADTVGTMAGGRNYLSLLEKLLCHGNYIPSQQLKKALKAVLRLSCSDHVRQAHRVLRSDLSSRQETTVPENCIWQLLERCMKILQQVGGKVQAVSRMAAEVVLDYLFGLLVKDFNAKTENPKSSLVEKALSLSRHWPRVTRILDFLFVLHERGSPRELCGASDLGEVVLSLVSLPLLTCSCLDRRDQATRLAREFSERLGKVPSVETRKQLLLSLPSHYLRELVLDLHLEAHCALSAAVAQDSESTVLSIAKIGCVHLKRRPYYHDGRPHDDPGYFLFQLCHLLQSHIHNLEGAALLSFLVPSTPGTPLPSEWLVYPLRPRRELQESLWDLGQQVQTLTEQLTQDPVLLISLTEGENWLYLQLLQALTNQPRNF